MSQLSDVQSFIDDSRRVASPAELHELMQSITRDMGFEHFALVHHVDLRSYGRFNNYVLTNEFIALSNYPKAWVEQYINDDVVNFDPRLLASQRTNVGFGWDQLDEIIELTPGTWRSSTAPGRPGSTMASPSPPTSPANSTDRAISRSARLCRCLATASRWRSSSVPSPSRRRAAWWCASGGSTPARRSS